jgi:hypothetical protein
MNQIKELEKMFLTVQTLNGKQPKEPLVEVCLSPCLPDHMQQHLPATLTDIAGQIFIDPTIRRLTSNRDPFVDVDPEGCPANWGMPYFQPTHIYYDAVEDYYPEQDVYMGYAAESSRWDYSDARDWGYALYNALNANLMYVTHNNKVYFVVKVHLNECTKFIDVLCQLQDKRQKLRECLLSQFIEPIDDWFEELNTSEDHCPMIKQVSYCPLFHDEHCEFDKDSCFDDAFSFWDKEGNYLND